MTKIAAYVLVGLAAVMLIATFPVWIIMGIGSGANRHPKGDLWFGPPMTDSQEPPTP
jgi:hypothetical protein